LIEDDLLIKVLFLSIGSLGLLEFGDAGSELIKGFGDRFVL
jgi:hypothetical protein